MTALICRNLLLYSLQIGMVVGLAAIVPALVRLRLPHARLAFWHMALAACLLLPFVHPWRQQVIAGDVSVTTTILAVGPAAAPAPVFPLADLALVVLAAGVLLRLAWLGAGFWRLRRYRRDLARALRFRCRAHARRNPGSRGNFQPRHVRRAAPCHPRSGPFPGAFRGRPNRHPLPRASPCRPPRLARHRSRGTGPRRALVPSRHLVAALRNSTRA